jgi:hypothetical protein
MEAVDSSKYRTTCHIPEDNNENVLSLYFGCILALLATSVIAFTFGAAVICCQVKNMHVYISVKLKNYELREQCLMKEETP